MHHAPRTRTGEAAREAWKGMLEPGLSVWARPFPVAEQRLHGFEALVRWEHPTRGRLSASEFVSEANDSGLIVQIGRWVLRSRDS